MRMGSKVGIIIITYGNPPRLARLLDNMKWSGTPDIPIYIFEDPSPYPDSRDEITNTYHKIVDEKCQGKQIEFWSGLEWGCMQGITEYAMRMTSEDWMIWIPDDVLFTPGALWNEYAGVLAYGRDFVGGIQAPYWNRDQLMRMNIVPEADLSAVPQNSFWNDKGLPRAYMNLNGAGFSINRELWQEMGGFPKTTWRLDEYAGFAAWKLGYVIITLPGQPRVHELGGSTSLPKPDHTYHSVAGYEEALGMSMGDACGLMSKQMLKLPDGQWPHILEFFAAGGSLND